MKSARMNFLALVVLSGFSKGSIAADRQLPTVRCELVYTNSATGDFKIGELVTLLTDKSASTHNEGFTLEGRLEQVCAEDGGPCSDTQDLTVTIAHGDAKSVLSVFVPTDKKWERWHTALIVGSEKAFANCDLAQ